MVNPEQWSDKPPTSGDTYFGVEVCPTGLEPVREFTIDGDKRYTPDFFQALELAFQAAGGEEAGAFVGVSVYHPDARHSQIAVAYKAGPEITDRPWQLNGLPYFDFAGEGGERDREEDDGPKTELYVNPDDGSHHPPPGESLP